MMTSRSTSWGSLVRAQYGPLIKTLLGRGFRPASRQGLSRSCACDPAATQQTLVDPASPALYTAAIAIILMLGFTVAQHPSSATAATHPAPTQRSPIYEPDWWSTSASWYAPTGNATSCGKPMTNTSWHVAALTPGGYQCGRPLTICHRRTCVSVRVQDRGAWRGDNRRWDLTPRVRAALHCSSLCTVRWHSGWSK